MLQGNVQVQNKIKKLLGITILSLLISGKAYSAQATCFAGACDFFFGLWYEYAETNCTHTFVMEEVEQDAFGFTIVETGEWCLIYNER